MKLATLAAILALLLLAPAARADGPCLPGACVDEWATEGCGDGAAGSRQGTFVLLAFFLAAYGSRSCDGAEGGFVGVTAGLPFVATQAVWWEEADGSGHIVAFVAPVGQAAVVGWGGSDCQVTVLAFVPSFYHRMDTPCGDAGPGGGPDIPYGQLLP